MTASYSNIRIQSAPGGLTVQFSLANRGREAWNPDDVEVGYQVFDPESEHLVLEGKRTALPAAVEPGGDVAIDIPVELPESRGRWRLFVSPLVEGVAWFHEQGSPFLLVDTGPEIRSRVVTTAALRWPRMVRTMQRALVYPFRAVAENGSLIRSMVRRDILGRYRGSFGGLFWTVLHPLLLMATYAFVFGVILQQRFGSDGRPANFVLYFLAGMLPWLAFSEAVGRAPTTVIEHQNFVKKLVFPVEILPINLVVAGLFTELLGVAILLVGMLGFGYAVPPTVLWLPILLVPQLLLTLGLCWLLAALGVFFRDLGQLIGFVLTVWFFTTPICYPEAAIPERFAWLFGWNPMYVLVRGYRDVFLDGRAPDALAFGLLAAVSLAVLLFGFAVYWKLRRSFADVL